MIGGFRSLGNLNCHRVIVDLVSSTPEKPPTQGISRGWPISQLVAQRISQFGYGDVVLIALQKALAMAIQQFRSSCSQSSTGLISTSRDN